jgi:hypothetical protein
LNNLHIGLLEKLVYFGFSKNFDIGFFGKLLGNVVWMGFIWFGAL